MVTEHSSGPASAKARAMFHDLHSRRSALLVRNHCGRHPPPLCSPIGSPRALFVTHLLLNAAYPDYPYLLVPFVLIHVDLPSRDVQIYQHPEVDVTTGTVYRDVLPFMRSSC
jgi:hypothetical protein